MADFSNGAGPDMSERERRGLLLLLALAAGCLLAGLVMPMLTLSRFVFFEDSFSLLAGLLALLEQGHVLLFVLVTGFSIALPLLKLAVLAQLLLGAGSKPWRLQRLLRLMHDYGRWAMLDVLVVAVLIVTVKLGAIASVEIHAGLYVFGVAVLLIMWITHRVARLSHTYSP